MTKLFGILATLAVLTVSAIAVPPNFNPSNKPQSGTLSSRTESNKIPANKNISPNHNPNPSSNVPNIAQAKHNDYTVIEARQYHNADYGSDAGPTGNPQPASDTASPTSSSQAEHTVDGTQQNRRRAEDGNLPHPTHAIPN